MPKKKIKGKEHPEVFRARQLMLSSRRKAKEAQRQLIQTLKICGVILLVCVCVFSLIILITYIRVCH